MLHDFIELRGAEIISRVRAKVATRAGSASTAVGLMNGVPLFLTHLAARLDVIAADRAELEGGAAVHGRELLELGYSVREVVHGYGDICEVIMQLADETDAHVTAKEFRTLSRCLDEAVAETVSEYERRRDAGVVLEGTERLGVLAHEMRNRLAAAMLAFGLLQEGTVGVGGSTGAVLGRNLRALRDLINNSLAGARIEAGLVERTTVSVTELVRDVSEDAAMDAAAGGYHFVVSPVEPVAIMGDRQLLTAAVGNLLQNALKFTRRGGRVLLRVLPAEDRVILEVEDECGGLPPGELEGLFLALERRSAARSGLGLGLGITRRGVEAMGGRLRVRDLPAQGCVFSIEMPRATVGVA